ncbi:MAG: DUF2207 domain-containing protein [Gammaproteobacteria bacterium]|nr:DUF2207 domain-containing protein [Gammaproteobacteria bacterium]
MSKITCLLTFLCSIFCYTHLYASSTTSSEQILGFYSAIKLNTDATLEITETLSVYGHQEKLAQAMRRYLSKEITNGHGLKQTVNYNITHVSFNDKPAHYAIIDHPYYIEIIVDEAKLNQNPDIYIYRFSYTVQNAIRYFDQHDELFWPITGYAWSLPILKVQADISLPSPLAPLAYAGHTGAIHSKQSNVTARITPGHLSFSTTHTFLEKEGLAIQLSLPKGVLQPPNYWNQLRHFFSQSQVILVAILFIFLIYSGLVARKIRPHPPHSINLFYFPAILSLCGLLIVILSAEKSLSAALALFWLICWAVACVYFLKSAICAIKLACQKVTVKHVALACFATFTALPFLLAFTLGAAYFHPWFQPYTLPLLSLLALLNLFLYLYLESTANPQI